MKTNSTHIIIECLGQNKQRPGKDRKIKSETTQSPNKNVCDQAPMQKIKKAK